MSYCYIQKSIKVIVEWTSNWNHNQCQSTNIKIETIGSKVYLIL